MTSGEGERTAKGWAAFRKWAEKVIANLHLSEVDAVRKFTEMTHKEAAKRGYNVNGKKVPYRIWKELKDLNEYKIARELDKLGYVDFRNRD